MNRLDCLAALKALGEETRLRMLRLLFESPLTVNEVSGRLNISQYNASKHLRIMRDAGLLIGEKRGKFHLYSLSPKFKRAVIANNNVLDLGCCTFRLNQLPK